MQPGFYPFVVIGVHGEVDEVPHVIILSVCLRNGSGSNFSMRSLINLIKEQVDTSIVFWNLPISLHLVIRISVGGVIRGFKRKTKSAYILQEIS